VVVLHAGPCVISNAAARRGARLANTQRRNNAQQLSDLAVLINRVRNNNRGGQQSPSASSAAQQTLTCTFNGLTARQEIQFTAVGSTVGSGVNIAMLRAPSNTQNTAEAPFDVVRQKCMAAWFAELGGCAALFEMATLDTMPC
jgi:hypothetical protein